MLGRFREVLFYGTLIVVFIAGCDKTSLGEDDSFSSNHDQVISSQDSCGDGIVQANEECDDENIINNDSCLNHCKLAICGDGVIQFGNEACDNGSANSDTERNACRTSCLPARCGDGVVDSGEGCDDGNAIANDSCSDECIPARCGDGIRQALEECDDGNFNQNDACLINCKRATCGDGYVWSGWESCDGAGEVVSCAGVPTFSPYAEGSATCLSNCQFETASCNDCYFYPCGPYGTASGEVIQNLEFTNSFNLENSESSQDESQGDSTSTPSIYSFLDLYQQSVAFGGDLKGVLLYQGTGWCNYCQIEANYLNALYQSYRDSGFLILGIMAEDGSFEQATQEYVSNYAAEKGWTFPALIGQIPAEYYPNQQIAYPFHIFLDLTNMEIYGTVYGGAQYWYLDWFTSSLLISASNPASQE